MANFYFNAEYSEYKIFNKTIEDLVSKYEGKDLFPDMDLSVDDGGCETSLFECKIYKIGERGILGYRLCKVSDFDVSLYLIRFDKDDKTYEDIKSKLCSLDSFQDMQE